MLIKVFSADDIVNLEKAMNKFVKDNNVVIERLVNVSHPMKYVIVMQYRKRIAGFEKN